MNSTRVFFRKAKNAPKVLIFWPIKKSLNIMRSFFVFCPKLKNWWLYPLSVFGLLQTGHEYTFFYKNGIRSIFRGGTFDVYVHSDIFGNNEYEEYIKLDFSKLNKIIDIGAQTGIFTLYMLSKNPNLNILCVEAVEENSNLLKKNIEINNFSKQVSVLHAAAWRASGSNLAININRNNTGGHSVFISNKKSYKGVENVKTISLEDIVGENKCDLLKVDIEGAEYQLFEGAGQSVFDKIDNIVMEVHGEIEEVSHFKLFLIDKGYQVDLKYPHLWATKNHEIRN